ncbi:hypothetical protein [Megasphaera elsdenii]|uniref:hypothetical protein n=1 Tax=Megasphaera elsdenii TaxID=907 RepID=UPI002A82A27B|nr:hypothetical protein [Megasphaera elsdenii]MCI7201201.1 hypothetical protein [Megasphaera elsdenii]MDY4265322.1 hypothetical protein [Megasphaera elsdenii]
MATKFLDLDGLKYFKTKLESLFSGKFVPQGLTINGTALNTANITITDDTKLSKTDASTLYLTKADASTTYLGVSGKASTAGAADTAAKLATARTINGVSFDGSTNITIHATDSTARIAASLIGAANGVAPLGSDKKIPAQYIPGDIGDVLEGYYSGGKFYKESTHTTEITGSTNTMYVDIGSADNDVYRWSGTAYVLINDSVSTADKAVRDGDGNTISTTYVKKVGGKGLSTNDYTTAEKNKLAGLYNYTLPAATSSTLGGVKIGSNITVSSGVVSLTSANVTAALGYTPASSSSVGTYSALSQTDIDTCFA